MSELRMLRADQEAEWRAALGGESRHDYYHLPQYHALAGRPGVGEARCLVYAEGPYTVALPLVLRPLEEAVPGANGSAAGWTDATSVYGYPGPVASHDDVPAEVLARFRAAVRDRMTQLRVVAVFSRLNPLLPQHHLLAGLGECKVLSQTVSIDLTLPPEVQRARYRKTQKQALNRLRRAGLTCELDPAGTHLGEFVWLYHDSMRRLRAAEAYFFPDGHFERLFTTLRPHTNLFVCRYQGRMICAGLFLRCGGILQYHLCGTHPEYVDLGPTKLLIDEARLWGTAQGLRVLHLGGGTTARSDDSLMHFKIGFSDRRHDFAVWRCVLMPEVYQRLCRERARWLEGNGLRSASAEYFPAYRCPAVPAV